MKLLYFAWVRERIGTGGEDVALPGDITTVGALLGWLKARGEPYASALADPRIRAAVNQVHARPDDAVRDTDEVAFFPPVTGG